MNPKQRVLIAGIGGASLGTEILKSLAHAGCYAVYGCDINPLAFGHYQQGFEKTFLSSPDDYVASVLSICRKADINYIIPGGEQPLRLLNDAFKEFNSVGITVVGNSVELVKRLENKFECNEVLRTAGIPVPQSVVATNMADFDVFEFPVIVKPATDSGGSDFVFLAKDAEEAWLYGSYLLRNDRQPLIQEYLSLKGGGEFSLGVLSIPGEEVVGTIALKRHFVSKISIHSKSDLGIISSPYSQGMIDEFPKYREQGEIIARALGSQGPLNIQGRIVNGQLVPFEINARFSGSEYVRTMAGFNQPHIFLQYLITGKIFKPDDLKYGYYLRSLSEAFAAPGEVVE